MKHTYQVEEVAPHNGGRGGCYRWTVVKVLGDGSRYECVSDSGRPLRFIKKSAAIRRRNELTAKGGG